MRMIGVKENWGVIFRPHDFQKRCKFVCAQKIPLSLRCANEYLNFDLNTRCNHYLKQHQIGNIEMA